MKYIPEYSQKDSSFSFVFYGMIFFFKFLGVKFFNIATKFYNN